MKIRVNAFPIFSMFIAFLLFCFSLTLLMDSYRDSYAQKYNDPDDPSNLYEQSPQEPESMAELPPQLENEINDPGTQTMEPSGETSEESEQDGSDGGVQSESNQDENEKKMDNAQPNNASPSSSQTNNGDGSNKLSGLNAGQDANLSMLLSSTSPNLTNCSNLGIPSDVGYSTRGTLEIIFNGRSTAGTYPASIQIVPNPFTLASNPLLIRDNQEGDCNKYTHVISLTNIEFSFYTVKQIDGYGNIIKSFQIPVNKNWPYILVNIQNKTFTKDAPIFETVPNQYIVALGDNVDSNVEEAALSFASKTNAKILKIFTNTRAFAFSIKDQDIDKMYEALSSDSRFQLAEQNIIGKITQLGGSQAIPTGVKRVISGAVQFGLYTNTSNQQQLDADIAIIDTGVDLEHPDLYVYKNISFVNGTASGDDDNGHGSEVAGIAAAKNNMLGVVGMAPGAKLWSIKVCTALGKCPLTSQIEGIEYAIDHSDEIDVINISIENPYSSVLNSSIAHAAQRGLIVVVGAGNSAKDASTMSPASSPDVISVSGFADSDGKCGGLGPITTYGKDDTFANFSNFGEVIDIAGPAVDILTTFNNSDYAVDSGTSFAAPHVAGAAALVKLENKTISVQDVRKRLIDIGSSSLTQCDGLSRGYFLDDPDKFGEHLLYMNNTIDGSLISQQPESIMNKPQHQIIDTSTLKN